MPPTARPRAAARTCLLLAAAIGLAGLVLVARRRRPVGLAVVAAFPLYFAVAGSAASVPLPTRPAQPLTRRPRVVSSCR